MKTIKVIDDKTIEVDGKRYAEVLEPQAEFKVGQWLMIQHMGHICSIHSDGFEWAGFKAGQHPDKTQPVRLIEKRKMNYPDMHIVEQSGNVFLFSDKEAFRLATPAEIEAHLKKEAERRGYKGKRVKSAGDGHTDTVIDICEFISGTLYGDGANGRHVILYDRGQWAEILPDKKKLPKTKEESMKFLGDYTNRHCSTVQNFLDQYED